MDKSNATSVSKTRLDEAEETRLDAMADAEIDAGKGVPHEKVRTWLAKLASGERVDPPKA